MREQSLAYNPMDPPPRLSCSQLTEAPLDDMATLRSPGTLLPIYALKTQNIRNLRALRVDLGCPELTFVSVWLGLSKTESHYMSSRLTLNSLFSQAWPRSQGDPPNSDSRGLEVCIPKPDGFGGPHMHREEVLPTSLSIYHPGGQPLPHSTAV